MDERVEQWLSPSIQMKRELKPEEHEEIVKAIAAGDRVKATSLYLSATEGDLTTARRARIFPGREFLVFGGEGRE